jgi:xylose isomerase
VKAAGVDAIEAHQSVFEKSMNGDLDMGLIERARTGYLRELGMTVSACNTNVWTNPKFRLGGPCNPNPAIRRAALDEMFKGLEICKALKIDVMSVWPGSDGADYHFQTDYKQSIEWFTESLITLNRKCLEAGVKVGIEPKPYEPRELYMIVPTAASAIIVAQKVNQACGGNNCGLTIDYGHQKMEATTASTACDLAEFAGVPVHKFDINDARQGRNDQDLMFGTISIPESVEYLYTTFLRNYQGWYSQDQFTYREDPTRAIERSMINFANLCLKAVRILGQQAALDRARAAGTGPDILDVVSPVLVG